MEVKRVKPEVVTPPDTIDIAGLSLREAGALRHLAMHGVEWHLQDKDLGTFFRDLCFDLDMQGAPKIVLDFDNLHNLND